MNDETFSLLTATLTWDVPGTTLITVPVSPQPATATDLDRFWELVALPQLLPRAAPITDPGDQGTMEWTYTSGGQPVTVTRTCRPAPTTEEEFDRFWTNVMKPAILAQYATNPPD